ncbi:MAG: hypothetical protein ACOYWZ_02530 [Bacillota bacterium]
MDSINCSTLCPVCGYNLGFEPWKDDLPSDEICPSCGIQFGYDDVQEESGTEVPREQIYLQWRHKWISGGMVWFSQGRFPPSNWNPKSQLKRIGIEI